MFADNNFRDPAYIRLLAEQYPTVEAASTAIVNMRAIMELPKGTEYYFSDLHGEHEAFIHLLRSASGTIRDKVEDCYSNILSETERDELASLIYYPEEVMRRNRKVCADYGEWSRIMLNRLIPVLQEVNQKYPRDRVDTLISRKYHFIIRELLGSSDEKGKEAYCQELIAASVDTGIGDGLISNLCYLIQQIAVDNLHIIGDIFDRGPGAHRILDELMY